MKKAKRIFALLVAMIMVFGVSTTVFAATGDITINGALKDATYEAYKVFDATVSPTDSNAVSYTLIPGHDVSAITGFSDLFDTVNKGGATYVSKKSTVTDAQVITWLKTNAATIKTTCEKKAENTNTSGATSVTLATGAAGYYFIWSELGDDTAVTIDSAHPTATVNSKITTEPTTDTNAKKMIINGEEVEYTDAQVGSTITFNVKINATNYAVDSTGNVTAVTSYTVTDTPTGMTIDNSSVAVTVNGSAYSITGQTISHNVTDGTLTVNIPWDQTTYTSPSTIIVSYDATLDAITKATNKADVSYNDKPIGGGEDEVYNYTVEVLKVDANNTATKLPGAIFALKKGDKFYKLTTTDGKNVVSWESSIDNATTYTTGDDGKVSFVGLESGSYTLVEVKAPDGYNLAADTPITLAAISGKVEDTTTLTVSSTVQDEKGTTLPQTGGIGTTIFYVLGSILIIGAGVLLISKRRVER